MRNLQVGCVNNLVTIKKDINIDRSGLPSRAPDPSQGRFDSQQRLQQQCWIQHGLEGDGLVEKPGLIRFSPCGRLVERRLGYQGSGEDRQPGSCGLKQLLSVAQV